MGGQMGWGWLVGQGAVGGLELTIRSHSIHTIQLTAMQGTKFRTVRIVIRFRSAGGRAFHTSRASTSEPKGSLTFWKQEKILASSAGVVLRQPVLRPRLFFVLWNLFTAILILPTPKCGALSNPGIFL